MRERLVLGLALFVGVTAVAGGLGIVLGEPGAPYVPTPELLAHTPFDGFLVPGLLLAVAVGGSALVAAFLTARRSRFAPDAVLLAGGALTLWIAVEVALIRELAVLQAVYGVLGGVLLALGASMGFRSGEPRHRWVLLVTLAESAGYLAPATAGILLARAQAGEAARTVFLVLAGLVEGLLLGVGQAQAFPLSVHKGRYALLTSLGAGIVWGAVMSLMLLGRGGRVPAAGMIALGVAAGLVGLVAIGGLQWLELRRRTSRARGWIAWTALAWALALPLSFLAGPFVDERTPLPIHFVLWGSTGVMMAYVMALVTWQGARRVARAEPRATAP
jgi:hypothetical protein